MREKVQLSFQIHLAQILLKNLNKSRWASAWRGETKKKKKIVE